MGRKGQKFDGSETTMTMAAEGISAAVFETVAGKVSNFCSCCHEGLKDLVKKIRGENVLKLIFSTKLLGNTSI